MHRHGIAVNVVAPVAAVATPGVVAMGLMPGDDTHVEPVEQMAEAVLALATGDPATLTGRVVTSAAILAELGRPVRNLDGSTADLIASGSLDTVRCRRDSGDSNYYDNH